MNSYKIICLFFLFPFVQLVKGKDVLEIFYEEKIDGRATKNLSFPKNNFKLFDIDTNIITNKRNYIGIAIMPQLVWLTPDFTFQYPTLGYATGCTFLKNINKRFKLETNLLISVQNGRLICLDGDESCLQPKVEKWFFLQTPILLHYTLDNTKYSLLGGIQNNYFLKNISPLSRKNNKINIYGVVGFGYNILIYKQILFMPQLRFEYNLTDAQPGSRRYNNYKCGVMFGFSF
jgi:hypothetical protein